MFNKSFTTKSIFVIFVLFSFSSCADSPKSVLTAKVASSANTVSAVPAPILGQLAKIRGENQAIKITGNLKDSVEQQKLPNIWLEFDQGNGNVLRTELDGKFNEYLKSHGEALFRYQYVINHSENPDERYDASYNHSLTFGNSLNGIRNLEIDLPDGKRKLTEVEIKEILSKQSGLINDRYDELNDYFNPKN
ncbi:MAG: hypothetical protein ABJA66_10085 [Actinomycetota bacterium]